MFVKGYWIPAGLAFLALAASSGRARAQDGAQANAECARAYEQGQVQRNSGQLVAARSTLQACAREECPGFIQSDCATWYGEVQDEIPTLVFAVRSRGHDLSDVQVTTGERVLSARIDGQVIELDPGEYDFQFRGPQLQPLTQHFVIARGERNRLIQVELEPFDAPATGARQRLPAQRSLLLPGIFAGVGAAGVVGFAGLGAWGHASESDLKSSCSPSCSHDQLTQLRTKYLLADVSLGVGVASLALSAYFFFSAGSPQAQAHTQPPPVALLVGPRAASLIYGSSF
jgi:hypothetical protein